MPDVRAIANAFQFSSWVFGTVLSLRCMVLVYWCAAGLFACLSKEWGCYTRARSRYYDLLLRRYRVFVVGGWCTVVREPCCARSHAPMLEPDVEGVVNKQACMY